MPQDPAPVIRELKPETIEERVSRLERDLSCLMIRHNALLRHLGIEDFENTEDPKARSTIPAPPPTLDSDRPAEPV